MSKRPLVALDIGEARIGIAISNEDRTVALAHGTVHVRDGNPIDEIAHFLEDNDVRTVVVGWPLALDGTEGPAVRRTKQFLVRLKQRCPQIRCVPQDERLTSSAAEDAMRDMEIRGSHKKDIVDSMAACLILQMYLDRHAPRDGADAAAP